MADEEDFPHPYPAVDLVLITARTERLQLALIRWDREPKRGWALPGAYVQLGDSVEETGARISAEKLEMPQPLEPQRFLPLRPFSDYVRDPRRGTISLPRLALLSTEEAAGIRHSPGTDAIAGRAWADLPADHGEDVRIDGEPITLVFDHREIVAEAMAELRRGTELGDLRALQELLPNPFTLRRLQQVYEALAGQSVNRDSFRRKMLAAEDLLKPTGTLETGVEHRPAELYRWHRK
jgi:8-oxo-dGTP diphosphatase